jgi:hypothetical protein
MKTQTQKTLDGVLAMIAREKSRGTLLGGVLLRDLYGAVDVLWSGHVGGRARRAAMAEVERNTRGCEFRLDTPLGPLFPEEALWRYAGRPWGDLSPEADKNGPERPVWPKTQREAVAA